MTTATRFSRSSEGDLVTEPTCSVLQDGGDAHAHVVALEERRRDLIHQGLIRTHWNKSQLAKELGISRSNLIMKVERYGLDKKTV